MKTKDLFPLKDRKIVVIATGSIAAVKTPMLVSKLIKLGAEVKCITTPSASKLVSPLSLSTLSRNICYQDQDQWNPKTTKPLHISLAEWAELIVIAPLSASSLARWVHGLGEGLAASLLLAFEKPVIAAAAMNTGMWLNHSVQRNWKLIKQCPNVITLDPEEGLLACDRLGEGRMANQDIIELAIEHAFFQLKNNCDFKRDLTGLKFLVTAGPTIEDIDATRFLSNRSSGKMGVFFGQVARFRGANVDLIHGPLEISSTFLEGLTSYQARSANDMKKIIKELQPHANAIAMAAAIVDLRKKGKKNTSKLSKENLLNSINDTFEVVPDLLTEIVTNRENNQIILGFTALTGTDEEIKHLGKIKKSKKRCDLLMANPIDREDQGLASNSNGGWLLGPNDSIKSIPIDFKLSIANQLLDEVKALLDNPFATN